MSDRAALVASTRVPLNAKVDGDQEEGRDKGRHKQETEEEEEEKGQVMRKLMTRAFGEILEGNENAVYLGEDVEHGGYYLVTDGLREKFKSRVMDFPPDETSLLGAAMGFFHAGLLPICEIPYSAYLSCGFDMYKEAAAMTWLSGGRQPNGMILRIQGFGKGVFGGNFHTHNEIFLAPGLDVVCFSNGSDVRGMRHAARQAAVGRMVVSDRLYRSAERAARASRRRWLAAAFSQRRRRDRL